MIVPHSQVTIVAGAPNVGVNFAFNNIEVNLDLFESVNLASPILANCDVGCNSIEVHATVKIFNFKVC